MRPGDDAGVTVTELVVMLAIASVLAGLAAPMVANAIDAGRVRHAAGFIATRFRLARQQAVSRSAAVGVVFDQEGGAWTLRICVDQNSNGVRRADIASGIDACPEGPYALDALVPGMRIAVDPALRGPDGEAGSADPVRFGPSDIASFSPIGSCTAGSLFLRSRKDAQYLVRVAGVTGRTRILRYDRVSGTWRDG